MVVHCSITDTLGAAAALAAINKDQVALTTDFNMTCLKSIKRGEKLIVSSKLIYHGNQLMRSEMEVRIDNMDKILIAKAGVSFLVIQKR